ncbi:exodeoxyribonuclease VII large subunit [Lewinella sp. 4G2]|uniref:exodeoxyribonuclease VII large subunit n=1 Tax=Lewinella sp. 4G2 TaxID=1803372 RepID=UPI0007B474DE|nr:exodeoxyribonuclease VII large subunit [Lewinella sp. 4G2]OAV45343.1 exodeoxyribonuclease VII large subunit [Lewinella sp. 4G2]
MAAPPIKTYRLGELANFIQRVFALNFQQAVWVSAEIGQANDSRGNCWLTLVEKEEASDAVNASLSAVVWKSSLSSLQRKYGIRIMRDLLQDGTSVRLKVSTSFHQRYGLRLVVEDIDPSHTIGELERRRQLTLERLKAEGLLSKNRGISLSATPFKLAIISSETAAGLADFKAQIAANPYGYQFDLRLFTAAMQGNRTAPEIISRLKQIRQWPETFDAVIIIRGGGGKTDLAAFDDEDLARAVADYNLPVLSGIGHETDMVVLDAVVHTSLKTPTATAVFLIERLVRAESHLVRIGREIGHLTRQLLYREQPKLERLQLMLKHTAKASLQTEGQRLQRAREQLDRLPTIILDREETKLTSLESLLTALRPETTLARGYSMLTQDGKLVTSTAELKAGSVEARFKDGRAQLTVQATGGISE